MGNPTFIAIEHKVNWALCIAAVVITAGLTFSAFATEKSMTDAEYTSLKYNIDAEFYAAKVRCEAKASVAYDQCISNAKSSRNTAKSKLYVQRKVIIDNKHASKSAANTAKLDIHKNTKSSNTNTMPVLDELTPAFKKTRLI
jgi:hypothetical protein